jgi:hypothetical protein
MDKSPKHRRTLKRSTKSTIDIAPKCDDPPSEKVKAVAAALAQRGRARAAKLSTEERAEIARKADRKRWQ